jgi:hypothetical protein
MTMSLAPSADGLSGAIQIGGVTKVNITNSGLQFTKNKLINGEVTRINQRVFNGTWSGKSVWETQPATIAGKEAAYGYDMWFRSNAARLDGTGASENMAQWIEAGNYRPSTVHTLSGTGVTTTQITSPASGGWKIVVAQGATDVQVEEGAVATPFELRSIRYELAECQRYFRIYPNDSFMYCGYVASGSAYYKNCNLGSPMRVTPYGFNITVLGTAGFPTPSLIQINDATIQAYSTCSTTLNSGYYYVGFSVSAVI